MINPKLFLCSLVLIGLTGCVSQADMQIRNEAAQERRQERISALEKTVDGSGGAVYLFAQMAIIYSTSRSNTLETFASPSSEAKWSYSQQGRVASSTSYGEGFTVKIPLELGERFCLINRKASTKSIFAENRCAFSIVATENRRRYVKISKIICAGCYGGIMRLDDGMIDHFYSNPSKNLANKVLPTLLFSMFKEGEQMKRDAIIFLLPYYNNYGYVYDEAQFYALSDLSYEKEFEASILEVNR